MKVTVFIFDDDGYGINIGEYENLKYIPKMFRDVVNEMISRGKNIAQVNGYVIIVENGDEGEYAELQRAVQEWGWT